VDVTDLDGSVYSDSSFEKSDALGRVLASMALEGVATAEPLQSLSLGLRSRTFFLPIDNVAFQAAFLLEMFTRPVYGVDTAEMDFLEDTPELLTGVDVFDIGDFRMLTVPGELLPELAIGGYDDVEQPYSPLESMIEEGNENPPDLSQAPTSSPLKTRMGAAHNWIIGLGNDEVGYIIPPYNFKLHESTPYLQEAPGHHYEETNSLGPETAPLVEAAIIELLEWNEE